MHNFWLTKAMTSKWIISDQYGFFQYLGFSSKGEFSFILEYFMWLNFVQIAVYNFKFNKKMKVKINKPINPRKVN